MNFQEKLMQDLRAGHSYEDIMEKFKDELNKADATYRAEEEAKRVADEKAKGQKIADLANRMLEGKLTEEDVNWVINSYMSQPGEHKHLTLNISSAVDKMLDSVFNAIPKSKPSDEDILRDFVQKIM